jgi:hypothetical protein
MRMIRCGYHPDARGGSTRCTRERTERRGCRTTPALLVQASGHVAPGPGYCFCLDAVAACEPAPVSSRRLPREAAAVRIGRAERLSGPT